MTTLNVVVDEILATPRNGVSFYTDELARGLIEYAPSGCFVEGIVAASTEQEYAEISSRLPGLSGLFKSALTRRDLTAAWQHGFTPVPSGMIHAPSLFAPLRNHDRLHSRSSQIAVTIHDLTAWTHPEFLTGRQVSWAKAMTQRAYRYADAIVVPTHAVAGELGEIFDFGDRVRVIGGAVRPSLAVPEDADLRAATLELPDRYLLAMGGTGPRHGIEPLLAALAITTSDALPLLVVGGEHQPGALAAAATAAGLAEGRVRSLGQLDDADLAVVLDRATVFVYPTVADGFGMPMLEAFHFGTPVISSDVPSLLEVAGDAAFAVAATDAVAYPGLLAEAIDSVVADDELRSRLGILGEDRARLFSWRATAESVWQLHADL